MTNIFSIPDWSEIFIPAKPILEIFIRGSIIYIGLFTLLRLILKRQVSSISISDILLLVLIADAAQNAMADQYDSVTDGIFLVTTIIFWNFMFDWLSYRFPRILQFIHPPPLPLVKNGKIILQNMRREFITKEELMSKLREQGVDQ
jgi:uncharacterized membrane protein YcaP (DUF421 family)